jgi:hypothetical protein
LFWLVLLFRQGPVPVTTITIITTIIAKALSLFTQGLGCVPGLFVSEGICLRMES